MEAYNNEAASSALVQFNLLLFFVLFSCSVAPNDTVVVMPATETLSVNESVTFTCISEGGPSNVFQWSLNGVDLPGESGTMLSITGVDAADGGTYTCTVSNAAGVDQDMGTLFGEYHKSLLPSTSFLGMNDSLYCTVHFSLTIGMICLHVLMVTLTSTSLHSSPSLPLPPSLPSHSPSSHL